MRTGSVTATSPSVARRFVPESIQITDNGIIPLKERVVDQFYDPLGWLWGRLKKKSERTENRESMNREWRSRVVFADATI